MRSFLFDRAEQFVHEFASFARAPFDMTAYDARAQYNIPAQNERSDTPTVISHTSGMLSYHTKYIATLSNYTGLSISAGDRRYRRLF